MLSVEDRGKVELWAQRGSVCLQLIVGAVASGDAPKETLEAVSAYLVIVWSSIDAKLVETAKLEAKKIVEAST